MKRLSFFFLSAVCAVCVSAQQLTTGGMTLSFTQVDGGYKTTLTYNGADYAFRVAGQPAAVDVGAKTFTAMYSSVVADGAGYLCTASIRTSRGSVFSVKDKYYVFAEGQFELDREVNVVSAVKGDNYFNSFLSFKTRENTSFTSNEYMVPSKLYKSSFDAECNPQTSVVQADDVWFLYRDDRTPLPMVMSRGKSTGVTINMVLKGSPSTTVMADNQAAAYNNDYQFGSCGLYRDTANKVTYQSVYYPGTEKTTRGGKGQRSHLVQTDAKHKYSVVWTINNTESYADAVKKSWQQAFEIYQPKIYTADQNTCYNGLIETVNKYRDYTNNWGAPGWPWQITLTDFTVSGTTYQMGFVGMQIATGYYLFRHGIENGNNTIRDKGTTVLDFWANNCLTSKGMPRTMYYPGGGWASDWAVLRVQAGGMESLLNAWCYSMKQGDDHTNWLDACKRWGDYLVNAQNADGSYPFSWNVGSTSGNIHTVEDSNPYTTTAALRYLVELYIATNDAKYYQAAMAAGEYCFKMVHKKYRYCACVSDNPRVIDSESGYIATIGFLSLYDLTRDKKWLAAAEQAATFTETWAFCHEVPVENDRTTATSFPKDRSIVGQHQICIHSHACDLGFAWMSFAYYQLYMWTQNDHYLYMSRIAAHDTKQSMNWQGDLYPGQPKGLQLEAFNITLPRRTNGVETCLNWNYAAHLDPMFRFKDAFGSPDVETVEKMPLAMRRTKLLRYAHCQGSDYGQSIPSEKWVEEETEGCE